MKILEEPILRSLLDYREVIARMRRALIAQSEGECETPLPMHLERLFQGGEAHIKAAARAGRRFVVKVATTFPGNVARDSATGNGLSLLFSAETGEPLALLADGGHLTDVRTAAAAAAVAAELVRQDTALGILGTGIQARWQARIHAEILPLKTIWLWGRNPERVQLCQQDLQVLLPHLAVRLAVSPQEVAAQARLLVTATASRAPLLCSAHLQPGTHISAVGSDAPGKQELDPAILRAAALLLVDSRAQCLRLGELQHAPEQAARAVEIGEFCREVAGYPRDGITVADFTGLGVEDLFIAEYCWERCHG
jgi:ornithine cyclodeaminase